MVNTKEHLSKLGFKARHLVGMIMKIISHMMSGDAMRMQELPCYVGPI